MRKFSNKITPVLTMFMLAAGFLTASERPATAKVTVKERTTYYTVRGSNGPDIYKDMLKRGPNIRFNDALATAEIGFDTRNIKVKRDGKRCRITNVDVVVSVKYTIPKWRRTNQASRNTRNAWNQFIKTVVWHEKQHTKIARTFAGTLEKELKKLKLSSRNGCAPNRFAATSKKTSLRRKHDRLQRLFDKRDLGRGGRGYKAQLTLLRAK